MPTMFTEAELQGPFNRHTLREHARKRFEAASVKIDAETITDLAALRAELGA